MRLELEEQMKVLLSTGNPSKAKQIRAVFAQSPIEIQTLFDLGIMGEADETGSTLEENALLKARFAEKYGPKGHYFAADDTGIFISALGGLPGVHSKRWAGENPTSEQIRDHCLCGLNDKADRSAYFRTVAVLIAQNGDVHTFEGRVNGHILHEEKVPMQRMMPYSGIFVPDGSEKVWAEYSTEEENKISHRGLAFSSMLIFLTSKKKKLKSGFSGS